MKYTNSKLVDYTKISPNKSENRNHAIDTITIHCVVGQCSVETLGGIFANVSRQASCNYGIGLDGKVGMYCEEKDRSWCTSSSSNDNRAITIEVASDTSEPYKVKDVVYKSLIALLVDVCKRNDIKKLLWKEDKSLIGQVDKQNMTVHRWFANKSCPGKYLFDKHGEIAKEVNALLNVKSDIASKNVNSTKEVKLNKDLDVKDYKIKATTTLNVRQGPGTSCPIVRTIKPGKTYTITYIDSTEEWGKLKSGVGYIHLGYTKRV